MNWALFVTQTRKEQVRKLLLKTNSLRLEQKCCNLDKEEGNLHVEGEPMMTLSCNCSNKT